MFKKARKKVVIFDVDGTLIDNFTNQINVTTEEIYKAIKSFQDKGNIFCLCSDSSLNRLQVLSQSWHIDGPIYFEKGSGVSTNQHQIDFIDIPDLSLVQEKIFKTYSKQSNEILVIKGDVDLISNNIKHGLLTLGDHINKLILIDSLRKKSISVIALKKGTKKWISDEEMIHAILNYTQKELGDNYVFNPNFIHGILIINHQSSTKEKILPNITERFPGYSIFMVGDSDDDYLDDSDVYQCAVVNGQPSYKSMSDFISSGEYTRGSIEILNHIAGL